MTRNYCLIQCFAGLGTAIFMLTLSFFCYRSTSNSRLPSSNYYNCAKAEFSVSGTVLNHKEQPIEKAHIVIDYRRASWGTQPISTLTDEKGVFILGSPIAFVMCSGESFKISISASGYNSYSDHFFLFEDRYWQKYPENAVFILYPETTPIPSFPTHSAPSSTQVR